jgi:hypothetical protein
MIQHDSKLVKELDFNDGGSATVGNWTLYAETNGTSDGRDFSYNGSASVEKLVFTNQTYNLTEL